MRRRQKTIELTNKIFLSPGADLGLVVGGGAKPLRGALTQYIYTFSEKRHEIKEIFVRGGGAGSAPKSPSGDGEVNQSSSVRNPRKILSLH